MIDDTVRCEFNAVLPVVFVRTGTGQKPARDLARIVPFLVDFKTHRVDVDSLSDERGHVGLRHAGLDLLEASAGEAFTVDGAAAASNQVQRPDFGKVCERGGRVERADGEDGKSLGD